VNDKLLTRGEQVNGVGVAEDRHQLTRRIDYLLRQIQIEAIRRREVFAEVLYLHTHIRIPPSAFRLVDRLHRSAMRISDLATILQESTQTTARLVQQLEAKGILERRPDETDGRASIVRLTPLGYDLMQEMRKERQSHIDACLATWSDEQLEELLPLLTRLAIDFIREPNFTEPWVDTIEEESRQEE
jgi:DNA-binding MarR family transcriptional regulator